MACLQSMFSSRCLTGLDSIGRFSSSTQRRWSPAHFTFPTSVERLIWVFYVTLGDILSESAHQSHKTANFLLPFASRACVGRRCV